jgi:hypothetical protein
MRGPESLTGSRGRVRSGPVLPSDPAVSGSTQASSLRDQST